jgi:hypothetical protein
MESRFSSVPSWKAAVALNLGTAALNLGTAAVRVAISWIIRAPQYADPSRLLHVMLASISAAH